jgi:hypothetical protein
VIVHHTTQPAHAETVPGRLGDRRRLRPHMRRRPARRRSCDSRRAILQSPVFMGRKPSTPAATTCAGVSVKPSEERLNARLGPPEDQRVNVVRAFIGIDDLEVDEMPGDTELVGDAVAAEHVARETGDIERLAA